MAKEKPTIDSGHVVKSLLAKYDTSRGAWACVREVADQTGGANRRCDFMAMGCWRSVGLRLHGVEIKVSRTDWQKECNDITKADTFARHCHHWWLAFANGAAKLEEVPADWGVMEVLPTGVLKVRRQAAKRNPEPLGWDMVASLLRGACEQYSRGEVIQEKVRAAYQQGVDAEKRGNKWKLEHAEKAAKAAEGTIQEIKAAIGSDERWWHNDGMVRDIRAALALLKDTDDNWLENEISRLQTKRENIDKVLATLAATSTP